MFDWIHPPQSFPFLGGRFGYFLSFLLFQAPPSYGSGRCGFGVLKFQDSVLRDRCSVGDASRLFLDRFSKHLSSVLGRTEICHGLRAFDEYLVTGEAPEQGCKSIKVLKCSIGSIHLSLFLFLADVSDIFYLFFCFKHRQVTDLDVADLGF